MSMMACKCGAVLTSDGETWSCQISTQDIHNGEHQYNHTTPFKDHRGLRVSSPQPAPRVGAPGLPGAKFKKQRHNCRLIRRKRVKLERWEKRDSGVRPIPAYMWNLIAGKKSDRFTRPIFSN